MRQQRQQTTEELHRTIAAAAHRSTSFEARVHHAHMHIMHARMCVRAHARTHTMHTLTSQQINHTHTHTCRHTRACVRARTHARMHARVRTHTRTHGRTPTPTLREKLGRRDSSGTKPMRTIAPSLLHISPHRSRCARSCAHTHSRTRTRVRISCTHARTHAWQEADAVVKGKAEGMKLDSVRPTILRDTATVQRNLAERTYTGTSSGGRLRARTRGFVCPCANKHARSLMSE